MTKKAPTKKATPAKKSPKVKKVTVFVVQRRLPAEHISYSDPDRVFATKKAATAHAEALNRELRACTNPFELCSPEDSTKGGEKAFFALLKKLGLTPPKLSNQHDSYIDWQQWWNQSYFDMTDAQRDAIWNSFDEFEWYEVRTTTLE